MIPKIIVIVLNWNGGQDTIDCLHSLQKVEDENFDILVIDNGSKIIPIKQIESQFDNINILSYKLTNNFYKFRIIPSYIIII